LGILFFALLGFAVMGYHPGIEDDGVYLAAIKSHLNPALFPHDAQFFHLQTQATLFDNGIAAFVKCTGIPLDVSEMLWQFASILLILYSCWRIASQLFDEKCARWAGIAMTAAMLTLPVAGTALYLADQHLHPRNLAAGIILLALSCILAGKRWMSVPLLMLSLVVHPIMAAMGISFCFFLTLTTSEAAHLKLQRWSSTCHGIWRKIRPESALAAIPLGWIFEPTSSAWRKALATRTYYFLYRWTWYEWLGALAPLALFWLLWRISLRQGNTPLARFAQAVLAYGIFQQSVAMLMLAPSSPVRLMPLQPMRYLQLVYYFLTLIGGCLVGKYLLKTRVWRWAIFLLAINLGMFLAQRQLFASSNHLELPGRRSGNPWLQAFSWIRENTPRDAYFALDPYYLAMHGEDYHSFRALAERSQLADAIKDTAVVTQVPELAPEWNRQVEAQAEWAHFQLADFQRLKADFGVNWVLVNYPQPVGLPCPWHNQLLAVCQVP
jgi:hypothetical protein